MTFENKRLKMVKQYQEKPKLYINTEIRGIPKEWELYPITLFANITSSKRIYESDYVPFGIPFYRGSEITAFINNESLEQKFFISEKKYEFLNKNYGVPKKGDILITAVGTLGNVYIVPDNSKFYFKDGNLIWLQNINGIELKYFAYQIQFNKKLIIQNSIGSSQKALTIVSLNNLKIPYPPLKEQRAIATALSDADNLIESLEKLIAKKQDIKKATMQQLLTGKKRLPGFEGEWEVKQISDFLKVYHGRSQHDIEIQGGSFPILGTSGEIGRTNTPIFDKPSVLIGRKGTIDKPQYVEKPFWSVDTLFYTEFQGKTSSKFIYYLFCTIRWKNYNEASGVPSLNAKTIESIKLKIPKPEEQNAIAKVLTDMDNEIEALKHRLEKTKQIKQGMMQELLTGRIRLKQQLSEP